jgi:thiamine-monophosphate kinase
MGPIARQPGDRADRLGERELVARLVAALGVACPPAPRGPGSDCAALETAGERRYRIATVDGVLLGRHFDLAAAPEAVGHKLVHRNLSDLAAAGASPSDALLTLVAGGDIHVGWLEAFARGVGAAASRAGLQVVGGDVARGPEGHLAAHLAATGFAHRVLARHGARAGDRLYVTGELGGSRLGRHLAFEARLAEGEWLCGQPAVTACTDLSDGLATDLPGLLGGFLGAVIDLDATPVSGDADRLSRSDGVPALEHAWTDGEDHELLLAVEAAQADWVEAAFRKAFPALRLTLLGEVRAEPGVLDRKGRDVPRGGFSHFGN